MYSAASILTYAVHDGWHGLEGYGAGYKRETGQHLDCAMGVLL